MADPKASWEVAQRVEGWAGEMRVNLIRLVAIAAFTGHHLVNVYVQRLELGSHYHGAVMAVAGAWTLAAVVMHVSLRRRWMPPLLKYAAVALDVLLTTALLLLSGGPRSPLVVLLFVVVGTAPLRLNLRVVWFATLAALLSYAFVCDHSRRVRPEWRVPVRHHVILALALGAAGLLAGQSVRQARRLALDLSDRMQTGAA